MLETLPGTINQWVAAFGGIAGIFLIVFNAWHNRKMREYGRRIAEAIERYHEEKP